MTKIAENVLRSLDGCVQHGVPVLTTARGRLYVSSEVPAACVVLTVPTDVYMEFLKGLPDSTRPYAHEVVVASGRSFQIAIFSLRGLSVQEGRVQFGQRTVTVI
jgi:hypothetical protein